MNRLLVLAGVVALMSACSGLPNIGGGNRSPMGPGAEEAAYLGYHGPVHRLRHYAN